MPDDGPFGETFFEARLRAIVSASFLNNPSCGYVDSVCTPADHFRLPCELLCEAPCVLLLLLAVLPPVVLSLLVFFAILRLVPALLVPAARVSLARVGMYLPPSLSDARAK